MKLLIFSVFDKQVGAFMPPFYCRASGEAIRSFTDAVNDPQKQFGRYASDYVLMHLGDFTDTTGLFVCHEPVRVIAAHEVLAGPAEGAL